jgi:hypothetical protein
MEAGFTFRLRGEHRDIDDHLWLIVSNPARDAEQVLILSITTHKAHKDQACIIERGEHPDVTHRSCVAYDVARLVSVAQLYTLKDSGAIEMREPVAAALLARIRACAADSERLAMKYADLLIEQGLLDC